MALQCRVVLNENNEIDYVETEDGQRSQLFDGLVETLGGDKNSALGFYALTESEDFKTIQKNERLSQTKKQESNRGGEIATRAANFLRSKGGTNEKNSSWRQKQELETFAKDNDYWYDNYKGLGEYIGKGMESLVFLSKDGEKVFKVNDLEFYDTPLNYLNTINEHNRLFPEAPYKVIGFTTRQDTDNFSFVLEQPFIQAERGATQEEVNKELEKLGFSAVGEAESYKKANIEILDLHEGNVVVDSEGNIFFIDPVIFVTEEEKSAPTYSIAKVYKDRLTKEKQNTEFIDEISLTKPRPLVEPSVEEVVQYANATEEELTPEQTIDLQDVIMSLGVNNSKEAEKKLKEALETKGFIRFNKKQMLNSGAFNKYEVKQILNSKEKQDQVEQSYRALKNSPTIEVEYPKDFVYNTSEINSFGKQKVLNPFILQQDIIKQGKIPEGVLIEQQTQQKEVRVQTKAKEIIKVEVTPEQTITEQQDFKELTKIELSSPKFLTVSQLSKAVNSEKMIELKNKQEELRKRWKELDEISNCIWKS